MECTSRVHTLNAPLCTNTERKPSLQSIKWLKNEVLRELGDVTSALSLTWTRENGLGTKELGAQTSSDPCVLKALSGATPVTPLKASLQRLATAACS